MNVNIVPPPTAVSAGVPVAPAAVYVGAVKSAARPTASPSASNTVTVHEITSLTRTYVVDKLVAPAHDSTDVAVGSVTLNEYGLFTINAVPNVSFSVINSVVIIALDAVSENVKLAPPLANVSAGVPVAPNVVYVGATKSPTMPIARPSASNTVTVHEIASLTRTRFVKRLVAPAHDSTDAAVADDTLNENGLNVMAARFEDRVSVMSSVVTAELDAVNAKVKDDPPPMAVSEVSPVAPLIENAGVVKSVARPIALPMLSNTVTVHEMTSLTRTKLVDALVCPTHDKTEAVLGDDTLKENGLPTIGSVDDVSSSVIKKVETAADGAVKKKLKLRPDCATASEGAPAAPTPSVYVGDEKSVTSPTETPTVSNTVIVHEINSSVRTTVVKPPVWPTQESTEFVVGTVTLNENGLPPEIIVNGDTKASVINNVEAKTAGEVRLKVKLVPPFTDIREGSPEPPVE